MSLTDNTDISGYISIGRAETSSSRTAIQGVVQAPGQTDDDDAIVSIDIEAGEVQSDSTSGVYSLGLSISRRFAFGQRNQLLLSLDGDLYSISTDSFSEEGTTNSELTFDEHTQNSSTLTLNGGLNRVYTSSIGVFVPSVSLALISKNRDDDPRTVELVSGVGDTIDLEPPAFDSSYGKLDLDLIWIRANGLQFFANINSNFANELEDSRGGRVGARYEF